MDMDDEKLKEHNSHRSSLRPMLEQQWAQEGTWIPAPIVLPQEQRRKEAELSRLSRLSDPPLPPERREFRSKTLDRLIWFQHRVSAFRDTLQELVVTVSEEEELLDSEDLWHGIELGMESIERYLQETVFSQAAGHRTKREELTFRHPVPEGVSFRREEQTVYLTFPLWMFGGQTKNQTHHWTYMRHKGPFAWRREFWYTLMRTLLDEPASGYTKDLHDIFNVHATVIYCVRRSLIRDLDHYSVTPMINAFGRTGLIRGDSPLVLSYTSVWKEVKEKDRERVEVRLEYGKKWTADGLVILDRDPR